MAITRSQQAKQMLQDGGRIGLFKGAVASGENISPGTDVGGNVRDDNPFTGGGGGDGPKGPPSVINPPPKQETGINILKNRSKFAFNNAQKFLDELGNPYDVVLKDIDGTDSIFLGAYGVPETFIINNQLKVLKRYIGPINQENVIEIKNLLKL